MTKFKIKNYLIILLIAVFSIIFIGGCGNGSAEKGDVTGDNEAKELITYTIADTTGDWGFPTPYGHYPRGPGYLRMSLIFETLVWKDAEGLVGNLAEDWEYDQNENCFTFKLRQNVKWHDGEEFTADDVLFTFNYMKENPYVWVDLGIVKNVEAVDEYSVKISLEKPFAPFLENVAGTLPILPEHIYKEIENPHDFIDKSVAIGTGPFKLADYNKEQGTYLYEANYEYYLGEPLVDRLRFIKVGAQMMPSVVLDGTANVANIPPEMVEEFKEKNFRVLNSAHDSIAKLMFNHREEPFNNKQLRKAIAHAIDLDSLVQISRRGSAMVGSAGLLPSDNPWYTPDVYNYEYNPEKAKKMLEEIGYEDLHIDLLTKANHARDAELIKLNLEDVGITVNIISFEDKTVDNKIHNWDFQMAINYHGGLGGDPQNLNKFIHGEDFNSSRFRENQELNDLLEKQLTLMDREERKEVLAQIQKIYSEEIPDLALYYPDGYYAHDGELELYFTPGGIAVGVPIPFNRLSFVDY